jgi:hypothetical protein
MKSVILYVFILLFIFVGLGCGGGEVGGKSESSQVSVIAKFRDVNPAAEIKAAASTLTHIRCTVSGPGMPVMTHVEPVVGNVVEFTMNVPNGLQRSFVIEAMDALNNLKYTGSAKKDLDGTPMSIEIMLSYNPLVGTWGYRNIEHTNDGGWKTSLGTVTMNADGTGVHIRTENDSEEGVRTLTDTFTYSTNQHSNGSISFVTTTLEETNVNTVVVSDNVSMFIMDGTIDSDDQEMNVAIKLNTFKTYTNADLIGDSYGMIYIHDPNKTYLPGNYASISAIRSFDGAGNSPITITMNFDGTIGSWSIAGTYSLSPDGRVSLSGRIPILGYYGANDNIIVGSYPVVADYYEVLLGMKRGDRVYSTADLEGTWALASFGDEVNGTRFDAKFGTMTCNAGGNCAISLKTQEDGVITYESNSITLSVSPDGSFGKSFSADEPAEAAAIGNDGNTMIMNRSFKTGELDEREIFIGVKCGVCFNLAGI